MPNIVQMEFFHVGRGAASIEAVLQECAERIKENRALAEAGAEVTSGIKTVVRIFDEQGTFLRLVKRSQRLEAKHEREIRDLKRYPACLFRILHNTRRTAGKTLALREIAYRRACQALEHVAKGNRAVAIERWDHPFRFLQKAEMHEVLERVYKAKGVWLFVFKPSDLLSDQQQVLGYLM